MIMRSLEKLLFASRWLLAPFYLALLIALAALALKTAQHLFHILPHLLEASEQEVLVEVLNLADLSFVGSLVVLVIFSGYGNFVSRFEAVGTWPEWMARIDFDGLKLKLMSSIVAISAIQLLRAFMDIKNTSDRELYWFAGIHVIFLFATFIVALTGRYSTERH